MLNKDTDFLKPFPKTDEELIELYQTAGRPILVQKYSTIKKDYLIYLNNQQGYNAWKTQCANDKLGFNLISTRKSK